ncbi:MAG: SufE family protein [Rhodoglobus sp.]
MTTQHAPEDQRTPEQLRAIRDDFLGLDEKLRLQLLLEFSHELPELPPRYLDHPDLLERVIECQSPVYIFVEVAADHTVYLFATAPQESPTTRGFASILVQGMSGLTSEEILSVPDDYPNSIGLTAIVSPLRIRGMTAMLARIKRHVSEKSAPTVQLLSHLSE